MLSKNHLYLPYTYLTNIKRSNLQGTKNIDLLEAQHHSLNPTYLLGQLLSRILLNLTKTAFSWLKTISNETRGFAVQAFGRCTSRKQQLDCYNCVMAFCYSLCVPVNMFGQNCE